MCAVRQSHNQTGGQGAAPGRSQGRLVSGQTPQSGSPPGLEIGLEPRFSHGSGDRVLNDHVILKGGKGIPTGYICC